MNNKEGKQQQAGKSIYRTIGIIAISIAGILALISFIEFVDVYILGNTADVPVSTERAAPLVADSDSITTYSIINFVYGFLFLSLLAVSIWSLLKAKIKTLLACFILILIIGLSIFLIK